MLACAARALLAAVPRRGAEGAVAGARTRGGGGREVTELVQRAGGFHAELSRITRTEFGLRADNPALRAAIVNARWTGKLSENECWFTSEVDAMAWLGE